jgi:ribosomal protein S18 acetylase RimI-like enzyme
MTSAILVDTSHIRLLDVRRDLPDVADLIELCFANNMDTEGRDYIRYIRRAAHNRSLIRWVPGAAERVSIPLHGYVWIEYNRIIGNLTLIPFFFNGKWIYLIANVAVHPDYRRQGIARQLTLQALDHIQAHQVSEAWLQVRDDNPAAHNLYLSLGFKEQARRSTWQTSPDALPLEPNPIHQVTISRRHTSDWHQQVRWLEETYPPEVSWNLSFDWHRLRPGLLRSLAAWINGEHFIHWTAHIHNKMIGTATWEPGRSLTDLIWLGVDPAWEDTAILSLLDYIRRTNLSHPFLTINYPAGRGDESFLKAGFSKVNTLIWMNINFSKRH